MLFGVMNLSIWMLGSKFGINYMDLTCLVTTVQALHCGEILWGIFPWHALASLEPIEHPLNATPCLSVVANHAHAFMTTDHKAHIISK